MKLSVVLLPFIIIPAVAVASHDEDHTRRAVAGNADPVDIMGECLNSASPDSLACQPAGQDLVEFCYLKI